MADNVDVYGYIHENVWIFQRAPYIEDGWYIKEICDENGVVYEVWEIAQFGGNEYLYSTCGTFSSAYEDAMKLT